MQRATMTLMRYFVLLWIATQMLMAEPKPTYLLLWFDTEDYVEPAADDAAKRIADDLTSLGVRATFKIVGEKARVLESRGRMDVIRSLSRHEIGYHSNFHSIQPTPSVYLRTLGMLDGADEFYRREAGGAADLRRIFGVTPSCYGQPGSSWGPQSTIALRRMGIPIYLDEGSHVGFNGRPFWFGGLFHIFNMGPRSFRADLNDQQKNPAIYQRITDLAKQGGVISTYYHPTEFVTTEFWDGANFSKGESRPRDQWQRPKARTAADAERAFGILREYVQQAKRVPGVQFVTAQDLLLLVRGPMPISRDQAVANLRQGINYLENSEGSWSAAELLTAALGIAPGYVDGPVERLPTTYKGAAFPRWLWEQGVANAKDYIQQYHRLPGAVFMGMESVSLADFAATLARDSGSGSVKLQQGQMLFEQHVATDPEKTFNWAIHPTGFRAPELLELARLQAWTLKPAVFK